MRQYFTWKLEDCLKYSLTITFLWICIPRKQLLFPLSIYRGQGQIIPCSEEQKSPEFSFTTGRSVSKEALCKWAQRRIQPRPQPQQKSVSTIGSVLLQYFLDRVATEAAQDKSSFPTSSTGFRTLSTAQLLLLCNYPNQKVLVASSTLRYRIKPHSPALSSSTAKLNSHFFILPLSLQTQGVGYIGLFIYCSPKTPLSTSPPSTLWGFCFLYQEYIYLPSASLEIISGKCTPHHLKSSI